MTSLLHKCFLFHRHGCKKRPAIRPFRRHAPSQAELRAAGGHSEGQEVRHGAKHQDGAHEADHRAPAAAGEDAAEASGGHSHVQVLNEIFFPRQSQNSTKYMIRLIAMI